MAENRLSVCSFDKVSALLFYLIHNVGIGQLAQVARLLDHRVLDGLNDQLLWIVLANVDQDLVVIVIVIILHAGDAILLAVAGIDGFVVKQAPVEKGTGIPSGHQRRT